MRNDRRKFVAGMAVVVGGAAAGGLHLFTRGAEPAAQNEAEREVFAALGSYGKALHVERSGSDGGRDGGHVTLEVRLDDHVEFMKVYADRVGLPSEVVVRAEGNRLQFEHRDTAFTIEHQISDAYLEGFRTLA